MVVVVLNGGRSAIAFCSPGCEGRKGRHRHFHTRGLGRFNKTNPDEVLHRRTQMRYWRAYGTGLVQRERVLKHRRDLRELQRLVEERYGYGSGPKDATAFVLLTGEAEAPVAFRAIFGGRKRPGGTNSANNSGTIGTNSNASTGPSSSNRSTEGADSSSNNNYNNNNSRSSSNNNSSNNNVHAVLNKSNSNSDRGFALGNGGANSNSNSNSNGGDYNNDNSGSKEKDGSRSSSRNNNNSSSSSSSSSNPDKKKKKEGRADSGGAGRPGPHERLRIVTNHFPGMREAVDKGSMDEQFDRLRGRFPREFAFYPRGWNLASAEGLERFRREVQRSESGALAQAEGRSGGTGAYILKPQKGSCGGGIRLVQSWEQVEKALAEGKKEERKNWLAKMRGYGSLVAQEYISRPALLGGYKFDCRIYVVVTALQPLKAFVLHEGMGRVCVEKYAPPSSSNLRSTCVHLTNYAVNKMSDKFVQGKLVADWKGGDGKVLDPHANKRLISTVIGQLRAEGHPSLTPAVFWRRVDEMVAKTLLALQPRLLKALDAAKDEACQPLAAPRHSVWREEEKEGKEQEQEEEEEEKRARARAGSNKRRGILNPYTGEPVDPKLPPTVWVAGAGSDAVDGEYWQGARLRNGAPRYLKTAFDGRRLKICRAKGATSGAHKWWISRLVPKPNPNPNPNPSGAAAAAKKGRAAVVYDETDLYSAPAGDPPSSTPPRDGWVALGGGCPPSPRVDTDVERLLRSMYKVPKRVRGEKTKDGAEGVSDGKRCREWDRGCYQLLGFDFLLDGDGHPHLLEVNANPSMMTNNQPFDKRLKTGVLHATMGILDPDRRGCAWARTAGAGDDGDDDERIRKVQADVNKACKDVMELPCVQIFPERMFPDVAKFI